LVLKDFYDLRLRYVTGGFFCGKTKGGEIMTEIGTNFEKVREVLGARTVLVAEVDEGETYNGKEGRHVRRSSIFVSNPAPTERSYYEFRDGLVAELTGLKNINRRYDSDEYVAFEFTGEYSASTLKIQLFPDVAVATAGATELRERLEQ